MEPKDIKITDNGKQGVNWNFQLECGGFCGNFRIHFADNTRKNAKFEDLQAMTCYFEGFSNDDNYLKTYEVNKVTDVMLFVERKMQWILEHLMREAAAEYYKQ